MRCLRTGGVPVCSCVQRQENKSECLNYSYTFAEYTVLWEWWHAYSTSLGRNSVDSGKVYVAFMDLELTYDRLI